MKTLNTYMAGLLMAAGLFTNSLGAQEGYGEIRGLVKNTDLEIVPYATVKILQGDLLVGGTQTDDKGFYKVKPLNPGSYEVVVMESAHGTVKINKVNVVPSDATYLDITLSPNTLGEVIVCGVTKEIDYSQSGVDRTMYSFESISGKDLSQTAGYTTGDIASAIPLLSSDVVETKGGELHFRGARDGASSNYVDGVKTYGMTMVPGLAIENLTVFTGGVPAMYGDLTGGLVVVTTKSYFSGLRDKNTRDTEMRAQREEQRKKTQAEADEKNRQKEIEAEKAKEKTRQNP